MPGIFQGLAVALVAVGALAGCTYGTAPATTTQLVESTRVTMAKSYLFEPAAIRAPLGATVTWTNDDNFTHNVHVMGAAEWTSEPLPPGAATSHTFSQAGDLQYQCDFHPQMKGRIVVASS